MSERPPYDHTLLIAGLGLFLVSSPMTHWWAHLALPWYAIFVPWLLIIVLVWANRRGERR